MTNLTRIVHYGSSTVAGKRADLEHFVVMTPGGDVHDDDNAHVYLYFAHRFLYHLGMAETKNIAVLMRLALDHIRALVESETLSLGENYEFVFTSAAPPDMAKYTWKECSYQEQEQKGLKCTASHPAIVLGSHNPRLS